jgi:hypothetical protein
MRESVMYTAYYDFISTGMDLASLQNSNVDNFKPFGFSLLIIGPDGFEYHSEAYIGLGAIELFIKRAIHWSEELAIKVSTTNLAIKMSDKEWADHKATKECTICFKNFNIKRKNGHRVLHHHHMVGPQIRPYQTVCSSCNLKASLSAL